MTMSKNLDKFAIIVPGEASESDDYEEESSDFETDLEFINNDITKKQTVDLNCFSSKSNPKNDSTKLSTTIQNNGMSSTKIFFSFNYFIICRILIKK